MKDFTIKLAQMDNLFICKFSLSDYNNHEFLLINQYFFFSTSFENIILISKIMMLSNLDQNQIFYDNYHIIIKKRKTIEINNIHNKPMLFELYLWRYMW